ncbi:Redox-regulatory protein FAM213A [Merluccius polli]|uniref:Peroxiredoxin-like 2A n=1 Tax=Merluccius polli TaxID=89951 RepID=A0AA47P842_MERPO|nr:Redox-regulatory protein FAM213A [Merluccius polli]
MAIIARVVGAAVACLAAVLNYVTAVFLTAPLKASLQHLEETELTTLSGEKKSFKAKSLWADSGAVIMAEAAELSSLKPQLDELGVSLYAVVKEDVGTEIQNFKPYFSGEVFLDAKRRFYGPRERSMGLLAFLRVGVWANGFRAFRNGFMGNVFGEGFILGGVYVLGPGQQGIMLEHREIEFGDKVNILDVLKAARRIPKELVSLEKR